MRHSCPFSCLSLNAPDDRPAGGNRKSPPTPSQPVWPSSPRPRERSREKERESERERYGERERERDREREIYIDIYIYIYRERERWPSSHPAIQPSSHPGIHASRHPGMQAAIQASSHIYIHPWSSEEAEELMEEVEEMEEWATQHQYMIAVGMHIRSRWL